MTGTFHSTLNHNNMAMNNNRLPEDLQMPINNQGSQQVGPHVFLSGQLHCICAEPHSRFISALSPYLHYFLLSTYLVADNFPLAQKLFLCFLNMGQN
jgi:hypothetical protein